MAEYVTKIRTESGDKQIDYNALANLPQPDATLTKSGSFADAKATGDKITKVSSDIMTQVEEAGYVTETKLTEKGYVTTQQLEDQKYVTETKLNEQGYVTTQQLEEKKYATEEALSATNTQVESVKTSVSELKADIPVKIHVEGAQNRHVTVFNESGDIMTSGIDINTLAQISMTTSDGENILIVTPINI